MADPIGRILSRDWTGLAGRRIMRWRSSVQPRLTRVAKLASNPTIRLFGAGRRPGPSTATALPRGLPLTLRIPPIALRTNGAVLTLQSEKSVQLAARGEDERRSGVPMPEEEYSSDAVEAAAAENLAEHIEPASLSSGRDFGRAAEYKHTDSAPQATSLVGRASGMVLRLLRRTSNDSPDVPASGAAHSPDETSTGQSQASILNASSNAAATVAGDYAFSEQTAAPSTASLHGDSEAPSVLDEATASTGDGRADPEFGDYDTETSSDSEEERGLFVPAPADLEELDDAEPEAEPQATGHEREQAPRSPMPSSGGGLLLRLQRFFRSTSSADNDPIKNTPPSDGAPSAQVGTETESSMPLQAGPVEHASSSAAASREEPALLAPTLSRSPGPKAEDEPGGTAENATDPGGELEQGPAAAPSSDTHVALARQGDISTSLPLARHRAPREAPEIAPSPVADAGQPSAIGQTFQPPPDTTSTVLQRSGEAAEPPANSAPLLASPGRVEDSADGAHASAAPDVGETRDVIDQTGAPGSEAAPPSGVFHATDGPGAESRAEGPGLLLRLRRLVRLAPAEQERPLAAPQSGTAPLALGNTEPAVERQGMIAPRISSSTESPPLTLRRSASRPAGEDSPFSEIGSPAASAALFASSVSEPTSGVYKGTPAAGSFAVQARSAVTESSRRPEPISMPYVSPRALARQISGDMASDSGASREVSLLSGKTSSGSGPQMSDVPAEGFVYREEAGPSYTAPDSDSGLGGTGEAAQAGNDPLKDERRLEKLAQQVYAELKSRLLVERERAGIDTSVVRR